MGAGMGWKNTTSAEFAPDARGIISRHCKPEAGGPRALSNNHVIRVSSVFTLTDHHGLTAHIVCQLGMACGANICLNKGLRSGKNYPLFGRTAARALSGVTFHPVPHGAYFPRFRLLATAPIPTMPEPRRRSVPGSGMGGPVAWNWAKVKSSPL